MFVISEFNFLVISEDVVCGAFAVHCNILKSPSIMYSILMMALVWTKYRLQKEREIRKIARPTFFLTEHICVCGW